jgi:predicted pyridoxine 5'-phosphate oxidase superfamily flavin-nucleotide-binding protein
VGTGVTGPPGFVRTPDARTLTAAARPVAFDPGRESFAAGAPIGMLGIQLETRRRNRVNGTLTAVTENGFEVRVQQSFGNCPKYIRARTPHSVPLEAPRASTQGALLDARARALIERADTFFIATASRHAQTPSTSEGVDVSHRGGKPGFVRLTRADEATVLTWPDFVGNYLFNTIGNLETNPCAGLLFVDFDSGDLLSVTCHANVVWEGPDQTGFAGAERLISARVVAGVLVERAVPLRWSPPEQAGELATTGSW